VPAGGLGDAGVFSFHPRKSITTGEGGMLTTNDSALAAVADQLRNHGAAVSEEQRHLGPKPYLLPEFNLLGFNYRMTDLQGAVGVVQLRKLDRFVAERQRWAEYYREQLADIPWLRMPQFPANGNHAWQSFVTYVDGASAPVARNMMMEQLQARGIATRPGTHAVHMLGYYRHRFGFDAEDYPAARDCDAQTMAIPLHNRMTPDDYRYVAQSLHEIPA
jgi:dTDP-4-amino-4,6-dideoxygalactose transaminase